MLLLLFDLRSVYPSSTHRHHRYLYKMPQHIFHIASVLTAHSKAPANHPRFQVFKTCAIVITCCGNQKGMQRLSPHPTREHLLKILFFQISFLTCSCLFVSHFPHYLSLYRFDQPHESGGKIYRNQVYCLLSVTGDMCVVEESAYGSVAEDMIKNL